jgi:pyruvate,water dikinase
MAQLEEIYHSGRPFAGEGVRGLCEDLVQTVRALVLSLGQIAGREYPTLTALCASFERELQEEFRFRPQRMDGPLVLPLNEISSEMGDLVGGKAANLASVKNTLEIPAPDGFVVTASGFERFIEANGLQRVMDDAFSGLDPTDLDGTTAMLQERILAATLPDDLSVVLDVAYKSLERTTRLGVPLAMRSSAVGEDTGASFAGQYLTVLNVGAESLADAYKRVLASKYSSKAISYRLQCGLDDRETPMCVLGIAMVDARASGVIYTRDPSDANSSGVKINAIWGLGEHLVDGSASPDSFLVHREKREVIERSVARKDVRLVSRDEGRTALQSVPQEDRDRPCLDDRTLYRLLDFATALEAHFGGPQDIEWAMDRGRSLFVLQSRPLRIVASNDPDGNIAVDPSVHPFLLSGGKTASPGVALGRVRMSQEEGLSVPIDPDIVLVARTADPDLARVIPKARGIITDMESATSHLASVAREFGVPTLVDTKVATSVLKDGQEITLWATAGAVYEGHVQGLRQGARRLAKPMLGSPLYLKLSRILERVTPLNLIDPEATSFSPGGCQTLHDIIRFAYEQAVKEMFGFGEKAERMRGSVPLTCNIPLKFHLLDLGGGLNEGLTACDAVTADSVASFPFRALWRGFIHPGATWTGAIDITARNVMDLLASSITAGADGPPGAIAHALLSGDYMNLSARFGYHFATLDTLCGENADHNHASLQFSGGAGPVYGRVLRVQFLGKVLARLGFEVALTGDLLEASLTRHDRPTTEERLDQLGRLLAASRLLDMAIGSQEDVDRLLESFFRGEYDFLAKKSPDEPKSLYIHGGQWRTGEEDGRRVCIQDGSHFGTWLGAGIASVMGRFMGSRYQEFLDNIGAYYFFPLAVARDSWITEGAASAAVKPVGGTVDRAGGIAFGIRDINNYFVLRINALEDNVILFEFQRSKRIQRLCVKKPIETNRWYDLRVEIQGNQVRGYLDGEPLIEYAAERSLEGYLGLWTKADSVTAFRGLSRTTPDGTQEVVP